MVYIYNDAKIAIYIVSALLSLLVLFYFLIGIRKSATYIVYIGFLFSVFLWNADILLKAVYVHYGMGTVFTLVMGYRFFSIKYGFELLIIINNALCWFLFCLRFIDSRIARMRLAVLLMALPAILDNGLILTDHIHHWVRGYHKIGPLFQAHAFIAYFYSICGIVMLVAHAVRANGIVRAQSLLLSFPVCLAEAVMLVGDVRNLLLGMNRQWFTNINLMPVAFTVTMLMTAFASIKYRFLSILPIAARELLRQLRLPVLVVDSCNKIAYYNPCLAQAFPALVNALKPNAGVEACVDALQGFVEGTGESGRALWAIRNCGVREYTGEMRTLMPPRRCFAVDIFPIRKGRNRQIGRIITMNDITEFKAYSQKVVELAAIQERNRVAQNVHDTVGHTMTVLLTQLRVCGAMLDGDRRQAGQSIQNAIETAQNGLRELRQSVEMLATGRPARNPLMRMLGDMASEVAGSGVRMDLDIDSLQPEDGRLSETVFCICREAVTNSIRHGNAKNINIVVKTSGTVVKLFIADDGAGCGNIDKGYGLAGMEDKVRAHNGMVRFGSNDGEGFSVYAEIPICSDSSHPALAGGGIQ